MGQNGVILLLVFLAVAIYVSVSESKRRKQKMLQRIKKSWGKTADRDIRPEELEMISHYATDCHTGDIPCSEKDYIDDITWNDLSMDLLYKRMNSCFSSVGQEYLYKMLRLPFNNIDKLKETDRLAEYFAGNERDRNEILKVFYSLGYTKKISTSDYVGLLLDLKPGNNIIHFVSVVLIIISFVVTFGINPMAGVFMIIASVALAIISYYSCKAKIEPYFICITQVVKMVNAAKKINKLGIKTLDRYCLELSTLVNDMSKATKYTELLASSNESGSIAEILLDYIRMITHVDMIVFNRSVRMLGDKSEEIYRLIEILGYIECTIAVASYRESLDYWCVPEFINRKDMLIVKDVYHPNITNAVPNSINVNKNILLTGSNASGKSTFLKTIAINAILSQSIDTSVSKEYRAPVFRIYSSMSLKDNLEGHDSYYIVEIKALKRILDSIDYDEKPVLCFVDEVLRGTNTVERIAASSQILKSLCGRSVLCFAATHDIELTRMLDNYFDNYHFEEDFNQDVVFNYKLLKGPATTRNAIKLLKSIGYDDKIIKAADDTANQFLQTGNWC